MIHKCLSVGKRITLSSSRPEEESPHIHVVEVSLPLEVYWALMALLEESDCAWREKAEDVDISALYHKIIQTAAPYATHEADRNWLFQQLKTNHHNKMEARDE
jgi:hypothetical protein